MKTIRLLIIALLAFTPASLFARENVYDVLSRVLTPFVGVLAENSKGANRALLLSAQLEELTDAPPEVIGSRVEIALEPPNRLRLRAPILGEELTVCRRGQEIWVSPGQKVEALLRASTASKELPPLDPKYRLAPMRLPIPAKQLVFLPALFQVRDSGSEAVGEEMCRVLDLQLMPEVARSLDAAGWTARAWVRSDYRLARLMVSRPGWTASARFTRVEFLPSLPPETWKPSAEQAGDVAVIPPARFDQLIRALFGTR